MYFQFHTLVIESTFMYLRIHVLVIEFKFYGYVFPVMYNSTAVIEFTVMYSRLSLLDIEFTVMYSVYQFNKGDTSNMMLTSRHGSGKFCITVLI